MFVLNDACLDNDDPIHADEKILMYIDQIYIDIDLVFELFFLLVCERLTNCRRRRRRCQIQNFRQIKTSRHVACVDVSIKILVIEISHHMPNIDSVNNRLEYDFPIDFERESEKSRNCIRKHVARSIFCNEDALKNNRQTFDHTFYNINLIGKSLRIEEEEVFDSSLVSMLKSLKQSCARRATLRISKLQNVFSHDDLWQQELVHEQNLQDERFQLVIFRLDDEQPF
jgi:hypothetical protein